MYTYTISDLKTALESKIHDQSLDKIDGNLFEKIDEAARRILLLFDPRETKRYATLYCPDKINKPYLFNAPEDMKGNSVITIRPLIDLSLIHI